MTKILITADIHLGYPNKLRDIIWSLKSIREYAKNNDIEQVFILGDLFHDRVNINIEVLNEAYKFFFDTLWKYEQHWVAFPGNHDMVLRNSWDINTLKPLDGVLVTINDIKIIKINGHRFFILPFIHYESVYMKVLKELEKYHEEEDVLLTHVGVHNATLNECFLIKNWSVVDFENSKFDKVFTGHFHCHQQVEGRGNVWYPGSPIPFRYDEGMIPHGFIEYDLESRDVKFIEMFELGLIEGPRPSDFITIFDDMIEEVPVDGDNVRIKLDRSYSKDELMRMRRVLLKRGAKNVKFQMIKDDKIDLTANAKSDVSLMSPTDLFNKWLNHDKPKKLDLKLLKKLNSEIINA